MKFCHEIKKRRSWTIQERAVDGVATVNVSDEQPSTFYALRLLLSGGGALVGMTKNGDPVKDHQGKSIDEAFFQCWRTPAAVLGEDEVVELRLRDNAVRLILDRGDRLVLCVTPSDAHCSLIGFVEVES